MTDTKRVAPAQPVAATEPAAGALRRPCVVVLGRDRGATRAVLTELAALLGVPAEHGALDAVSDAALARLDAAGRPDALDDLLGVARSAFADRFAEGERAALWWDEANAYLLPFFRRALAGERPLVVVLVPELLSDLAQARSPRGEPAALAQLASEERWLRSALNAAAGLPAYVVPVGRQAGDGEMARFLERHGAVLDPAADRDGVAGHNGRHAEATLRTDGLPLLAEMRELDELVGGLSGPHDELKVDLPAQSPWSAALVEHARDLEQALAGLAWASAQIEPMLRSDPRPAAGRLAHKPRRDEDDDRPENADHYPLNASEDRRAYHRWLTSHRLPTHVGAATDPPVRQARTRAPEGAAPLVSVVVPVYRPPLWALERAVGSVLNQDSAAWQLVLCDDGSGDPELSAYLEGLGRLDPRITVTALAANGGISAATNAAIAQASGEFVAFLDQDDELAPHAISRVAQAVAAQPDGDVFYSDEDKIDVSGERFDPFLKPEWSPDLLTSYAYVAHLMVVRRSLVAELGGLRSAFDGSQDWDLSLRATEKARRIVHIADFLYHWRVLPSSAASGSQAKPWAYEAGRRVLEDMLVRRGEPGEVAQSERFPGRYHVRRAIRSNPLVSVIIPFRDEPALLATAASSLREAPGYDNVELVLVNNGSELPETAELMERLGREEGVRLVDAPGPFNWAAINNAAVRAAAGDVLLFMNNDIEARVPGWLHALLGHAQRPEVGAVGGRLLYPDGTIQHAGVVLGLGGIAGHVLKGLPAHLPGYASMAIQTRNVSVVTGACMMVRREVFDSVGGFDEHLAVAFNDVDFCMKLREKGYLVVYEPMAELVHHESKSRGHTDDLVEGRRIVERWHHAMAAGDPYVNEHLSHWRFWCPISTVQEDERWNIYLAETSASTQSSSSST